MCGRFTLTVEYSNLISVFQLRNDLFNYTPRYNIAPAQDVAVIVKGRNGREITNMHWGLIPHWAREPKIGYKMINARAETIDQKPAYKSSFYHRRCLILADGFYEWKKTNLGKQPYRIILPKHNIFAFAGLWSYWNAPEGNTIYSCSIITTGANGYLRDIHDRMPVILTQEEQFEKWLGVSGPGELKQLLQPYDGKMVAYAVSTMVNSPKNDNEKLIEQV